MGNARDTFGLTGAETTVVENAYDPCGEDRPGLFDSGVGAPKVAKCISAPANQLKIIVHSKASLCRYRKRTQHVALHIFGKFLKIPARRLDPGYGACVSHLARAIMLGVFSLKFFYGINHCSGCKGRGIVGCAVHTSFPPHPPFAKVDPLCRRGRLLRAGLREEVGLHEIV